jgi:hypothetical protein
MYLNKQELAAVLVGLRLVADDIRDYGPEEIEGHSWWPQFEGLPLITQEQIDALCERLNCTPDPLPADIADIRAGLKQIAYDLDDSGPESALNRAIELLGRAPEITGGGDNGDS